MYHPPLYHLSSSPRAHALPVSRLPSPGLRARLLSPTDERRLLNPSRKRREKAFKSSFKFPRRFRDDLNLRCISPRTLDVDRSRRIANDRANDRSSVDRVHRVARARLAVERPSPDRHRFNLHLVSNDHADRSIDIDRVALTDLDACKSRERANARKRWDEDENGNRR